MTELDRLLEIFGGGDSDTGLVTLYALSARMQSARAKHPVFAEGAYHALGVIGAEYRELEHAVEKESPQRQQDEALDVAVTCLRFWLEEHEKAPASPGLWAFALVGKKASSIFSLTLRYRKHPHGRGHDARKPEKPAAVKGS